MPSQKAQAKYLGLQGKTWLRALRARCPPAPRASHRQAHARRHTNERSRRKPHHTQGRGKNNHTDGGGVPCKPRYSAYACWLHKDLQEKSTFPKKDVIFMNLGYNFSILFDKKRLK